MYWSRWVYFALFGGRPVVNPQAGYIRWSRSKQVWERYTPSGQLDGTSTHYDDLLYASPYPIR